MDLQRKILSSLFVLLILLIFNSNITSAASVDFMRGRIPNELGVLSNASNATDGDLSSYAVVSGALSDTKTITYIIDPPVNADSSQILVGLNSSTKINFKLYDKKGSVILEQAVDSNFVVNGTFNEVSKVVIVAKGTTKIFNISLTLGIDSSAFDVKNLKVDGVNGTNVNLSWTPVDSSYFSKYKMYLDNIFVDYSNTNSFVYKNLEYGKKYSFGVSTIDTDGIEYAVSETEFVLPLPDNIPPSKPLGLKVEPDIYTSLVSWMNGVEADLAGYDLYLNENKYNSMLIRNNNIVLSGLKPEMDYEVYIVAVDNSGNISESSEIVKFKTLPIKSAPTVAPVLAGYVGNGTANLNWTPVMYADTYEVFQDNDLIAETNATRLNLKKLQNETSYDFHVVAVNDIGRSPKSNILTIVPSEKFVPDISLGYSLKDVSDGAANWFSQYWLILAFCIAIPLSFYIANRIKGLFA